MNTFARLFALTGLLLLVGCPMNPVVRPTAPMVDAKESNLCKEQGPPSQSTPMVVHWTDTDRNTLESAMSRGVAVVKYPCD